MTHQVKVYLTWNTTYDFEVHSINAGREYAKRIITEGLWYKDTGDEIFIPVHNIVKIKIIPIKRKVT